MAERGGLKEFRALMGDFKDLGGLGLKGAVAAPLADNWVKFGPPPTALVSFGAALAQLMALVCVFHFGYGLPRRRLDRHMRLALVAFVVLAAAGLYLVQSYTVPRGGKLDRVVVGYALQPEIRPLLSPTDTPERLLEGAAYDATQVWTKPSVATMATVLPLVWIGAFAALSTFLGTFVMAQRRDAPEPSPAEAVEEN